jgi:O-antigen ligase
MATRVLQIGAIAVVLVATTLNVFELDRFFVPKEIVLHVVAVIAAIATFRRMTFVRRVDSLLIIYLLLGVVSVAFATNKWLGIRALAISASSVLLFWSARVIGRPLLNALALAVVAASVTSLLQAYGADLIFFSDQRAPGGTLGNRNFVAHLAAFGLPLVLLATLRARRFFFGAIGTAIVVASLVLTRSRAAWLAFAAVVVVFIIAMLISPILRRDAATWKRLAAIVMFVAGGVAGALLIPNDLHWRSDNPYLESVKHVADYSEGSGRGRLVQYTHSLWLALRNPILGVGPGNWAVKYPIGVRRSDPSISDTDAGMTTNPWPSSDWVAYVAERGFVAAALIAIALLTIGLHAYFRLQEPDHALVACALLGTLAGALVTGMFDAVLLLAVPSFIVWSALGAMSEPGETSMRRAIVLAVIVIAAIGAARSTAQLVAMQMYASRGDRASLANASRIDPGNFRLHLRLARSGPRRERCAHAAAAHALFPSSRAAADASRSLCGDE